MPPALFPKLYYISCLQLVQFYLRRHASPNQVIDNALYFWVIVIYHFPRISVVDVNFFEVLFAEFDGGWLLQYRYHWLHTVRFMVRWQADFLA